MIKKEVKKEVKKSFLLNLLEAIKQGKNPSQIAKEKGVSKQKLNYYIKKLKEQGMIKKIGYGVWELTERSKKLSEVTLEKEVRGHAFMWKVKIPKIRNWEKRIKILDNLSLNYKLIGAYNTPRILFKDRKIWLGNKNLVIYEPHSFIEINALESRRLAVYSLKMLLEALENRLKVSFKINGNYEFKVARQHYALMRNLLAIQCNKENEKIYVYDKGNLWFCIDNSYNLNEAETLNKNALETNLGVQKYFNSHKATNFKVTPEYILNIMNGIQANQLIFDKNMKSHIQAINQLGLGMRELTKVIRETKLENLFLRKKLDTKNQKKLSDFIY